MCGLKQKSTTLIIVLSAVVQSLEFPKYHLPFKDGGTLNSSDTYNSYQIIGDISELPLISKFRLNKCHCDRTEIWAENKCKSYSGLNIPILSENQTYKTYLVNETIIDIHSVNFTCPKNYKQIYIDFSSFNLLTSGSLWITSYSKILKPSEFCIENVQNENGDVILKAEICLPITPLQFCCPRGESINPKTKICEHKLDDVGNSLSINFDNREIMIDDFSNFQNTILKCGPDEAMQSADLNQDNFLSFNNEEIFLDLYPMYYGKDAIAIPFQKFCLNSKEINSKNTFEAIYCYNDKRKSIREFCSANKCLRKCCSEGLIINSTSQTCINYESDQTFPIHPENGRVFEYGLPLCKIGFVPIMPYETPDDEFNVLENGHIHFPKLNQTILPHLHCVDNFLLDDSSIEFAAYVCVPEEPAKPTSYCVRRKTIIYQVLFVISSVFLFIALLVYLSVPDLQESVYDRCLAAHISSLLFGFISLMILEWATEKITIDACIFMGNVFSMIFFMIYIIIQFVKFIKELYESNWCAIGETPSMSPKNNIKFNYFDTPGSSFSRKLSKVCIY